MSRSTTVPGTTFPCSQQTGQQRARRQRWVGIVAHVGSDRGQGGSLLHLAVALPGLGEKTGLMALLDNNEGDEGLVVVPADVTEGLAEQRKLLKRMTEHEHGDRRP